jgi:uncharacterized protein YbjT (DUF2867 family)
MRVAVAGATGRIGSRTVAALMEAGHHPVPLSRSHNVDISTGTGLDEALSGVDAVVDVLNTPEPDPVPFFRTTTANLLDAEARAGVRHHVLLSIVGIHRVADNVHYAGKRAQEELVAAGPVPWTVLAATQFHDFPVMVASWTRDGGGGEPPTAARVATSVDTVTLPPLLMQPVAPADVAGVLAELAVGIPLGRLELAGPERQDLVDMARRTLAARGDLVRIVPTWDGMFGESMAGNVLLPGPGARIAKTTFEEWLASGGM